MVKAGHTAVETLMQNVNFNFLMVSEVIMFFLTVNVVLYAKFHSCQNQILDRVTYIKWNNRYSARRWIWDLAPSPENLNHMNRHKRGFRGARPNST